MSHEPLFNKDTMAVWADLRTEESNPGPLTITTEPQERNAYLQPGTNTIKLILQHNYH